MSDAFRHLLKKIGSGFHTGENLTRLEAKSAMQMLLQQHATPAQIGAFLIAHRIKRPTAEELAGMLDAYEQLGPQFSLSDQIYPHSPVILGNPYDGRSRTVPVTVITALLLASVDQAIILHGGERMPTKYGLPLIQIWQGLGVDFTQLSLAQVQTLLEKTGLSFLYLPNHFPMAYHLVPYRDEIGKRPPIATIELIWAPILGQFHLIYGYVHPPTEERFRETLALRKVQTYTSIKGLEGSCDLACNRTGIIGMVNNSEPATISRLFIHPRDFGFCDRDVALESDQQAIALIQDIIRGDRNILWDAVILNGGFYLWRCGKTQNLETGFIQAEKLISQGLLADKLSEIRAFLAKNS